ncbi:sugar transferase [Thioalkalivibrio sulfidiphilus]|uniref:sugar transferase n=1 Tax=Thioalkalivibrio sulfidiphilus TaxID=1033854 RepID=UPI003B3525AC
MKSGFVQTYASIISFTTRVLDVLLIWGAGLIALGLRFGWDMFPLPPAYGAFIVIGGLLSAVVFPVFGVYGSWRARGLVSPGLRVVGAWSLVFVILLISLVLVKQAETFSRLWLAQWWLLSGLVLVIERAAVYFVLRGLRQRGMNHRKAVVVGCGPQALNLINRAEKEGWAGFDVVRVFGERPDDTGIAGRDIHPLDELFDYVSSHQIDEVWIAMPLDQSQQLKGVLENLRFSTANVRFVPDLFGLFLINHGVSEIMDVPMIDLSASPMTGANRLVKGIEDRGLALLILLVISPLLLVIALGVKLSSKGPIFFRQERVGWNGVPFEMLKFRSMPVDVEKNGVEWGNAQNKRLFAVSSGIRSSTCASLRRNTGMREGCGRERDSAAWAGYQVALETDRPAPGYGQRAA